jgi:hypothetical protein
VFNPVHVEVTPLIFDEEDDVEGDNDPDAEIPLPVTEY